jgi:hypothetical protein
MSAKHTPTPWDFTAEPGIGVYVHATDEFTTDVAEMICAGHSDEAVVTTARRIVACVNACESFSTEMLEGAMSAVVQGGFVGMWSNYCDKKSEAEDLRAQRDELLAALRHIEGGAMDVSCERASIRDAARAAIAKATGGKA